MALIIILLASVIFIVFCLARPKNWLRQIEIEGKDEYIE